MKKFLVIFISILFMFYSCIPAFAENNYSHLYEDSSDIDSVKNKFLNQLNEAFYRNQNEKLSFDDLDYDGILKIYSSSDLLKKSGLSLDELNSFMKNSEWFYRLYFNLNNGFIEAVVEKGGELTEEEKKNESAEYIRYLKENVIGQWMVSSYSYDEVTPNPNYKKNIEKVMENSNTKYSNVYFSAYLSGNIHFAAILVDENSEIKFNILEGYYNNKTIDSEHPDDTLYSFEEMKEIAAQYIPPEPGYIGGINAGTNQPSNSNIIIIAAASACAVIVIAAAAAAIIIKKKRKSAQPAQ